MSKKIIFVADMFASDSNGGAELTSEAILEDAPYNVERAYCHQVNEQFVKENENSFWIFGNFSSLQNSIKLHFVKNEEYSVIEYDYKYCKFRSDDLHKLVEENCDCEKEHLGKINAIFLSKAVCTWWMSEKQRDHYFSKFQFLEKSNNKVLSSVFNKKTIEFFDNFSLSKDEKCANWIIMDSPSWIKNSQGCQKHAIENGMDYELVWNIEHAQLLHKLATSKGLISLPLGKDTCPRLVIEAKLLDCELVLNDNVQHKNEEWFSSKSTILQYLKTRGSIFWGEITKYV